AFGKRDISPHSRIEACFLQFFRRIPLGFLAACTNHANQTLRHDAVEGGDKVVRLNAHVDEAADNVGNVVGVDGSEDEVAGERRNQDHAVRFADVAPEAASLFVGETNHVQGQAGELFRKRFLVEDAENGVFPVTRRHDGDAQIDEAPFVFYAEAAVLRDAALG